MRKYQIPTKTPIATANFSRKPPTAAATLMFIDPRITARKKQTRIAMMQYRSAMPMRFNMAVTLL